MNTRIQSGCILTPEIVESECRPYDGRKLKEYDCPYYFVFDLECQTTGEKHVPIISGFCDEKLRCFQFRGPNNIQRMFDKVVEKSQGYSNVIGYAHFMKYDLYVMAEYLSNISMICIKENLVYAVKNSYKVIVPLKDFKKMFDLSQGKKEAIPYEFYTMENIVDDSLVDVNTFRNAFKTDKDKELFDTILQEEIENDCPFFDVIDGRLDHVAYNMMYHEFDLITLMKGIKVLRQRVNTLCQETLGFPIDIWVAKYILMI